MFRLRDADHLRGHRGRGLRRAPWASASATASACSSTPTTRSSARKAAPAFFWKVATDETKPLAAEALRMTAKDLHQLGVIDDIIPEPLGGAHRDQADMANTLKTYLLRYLRELEAICPSTSCSTSVTRSSAAWAFSRTSELSGRSPAAARSGRAEHRSAQTPLQETTSKILRETRLPCRAISPRTTTSDNGSYV